MLKRVRIALTALLLLAAVGVNAQVTTASMAGKVTDASNEPIIGATVQAVHQPSGSRYGTVTNVDGRYSIQGMRTGGPYRVEISYIGYQTVIYKDITLQLGEVYNLNVEMSESSELLNEVIVTAAKTKFTAEKTGATTNISSAQITQLPTVNRSISDIARLSPYANGMSLPAVTDVPRTSLSTVPTSTITSDLVPTSPAAATPSPWMPSKRCR